MKFLLDENQSPRIAELLAAAGHDTVHVRELNLSEASDADIMRAASEQGRVIVSADTDFGELLARTNASEPSILLLRRTDARRARDVAELILANLDQVAQDLDNGAIVTIEASRVRVRELPMFASGIQPPIRD